MSFDEKPNQQIDLEKNADPVRILGLQTIYAMKADAYGVSIEEGRLMTLDCFLMIFDYYDVDMTDDHERQYIEHEQDRIIKQADFVGAHVAAQISAFLAAKGEQATSKRSSL